MNRVRSFFKPASMEKRKIFPVAILLGSFIYLLGLYYSSADGKISPPMAFRQSQTAILTRFLPQSSFLDHGFSLVPVRGVDSAIPMEFPFIQILASLVSGAHQVRALELLSITFFFISLLVLWVLLSRVFGGDDFRETHFKTFFPLIFVVALSRVNLIFVATPTIEYLAIAASLVAILTWTISCERGTFFWNTLGILVAILASCSKITTYISLTFPLLVVLFISEPRLLRAGRVKVLKFWISGLIFGGLWTVWSDHIKGRDRYTEFTTSGNLRSWNFGEFSDRFSPQELERLVSQGSEMHMELAGLGVICLTWVIVKFWRRDISSKHFCESLFVFASCLIGPLLFWNLYAIHSYYWAVVSFTLPLAVAHTAQRMGSAGGKAAFLKALAVVSAVLLVVTTERPVTKSDPSWTRAEEVSELLNQSASIPEDADIITLDLDWDPSLFFLSNRRGLMLRESDHFPVSEELDAMNTPVLLIPDSFRSTPEAIESVYEIGRSTGFLEPADQQFLFAYDRPEFNVRVRTETKLKRNASAEQLSILPCNGVDSLGLEPGRYPIEGPPNGLIPYGADENGGLPILEVLEVSVPFDLRCLGGGEMKVNISS